MAAYAQTRQHYQTRFCHYPSPTFEDFTDSAIGSEFTNDPKSRLQTRWNELQRRVTRASLADETVTAIHKSLDHIDGLLSLDNTKSGTEETNLASGLGISGLEINDSDYTADNSTPTVPNAPEVRCQPHSEDETIAQSQALLARVTQAVEQLRHREEEFRASTHPNRTVNTASLIDPAASPRRRDNEGRSWSATDIPTRSRSERAVCSSQQHRSPLEPQTYNRFAQGERERKGPIRAHFPEAQSEDARDSSRSVYTKGRQRWPEGGDQEVETGLGGRRSTTSW